MNYTSKGRPRETPEMHGVATDSLRGSVFDRVIFREKNWKDPWGFGKIPIETPKIPLHNLFEEVGTNRSRSVY